MAFFDIKPAVGITVEAAEGYDQSYSGMQALIEGYQNDYALFTGALYQDINEYSMVHEGASMGEIVAFQEASISGFFNKIKEFFKKLWAKIKAIFHSFIAKFDSMFMKSGKALLKKYKKEIEMKKTTDLEVKFSVQKRNDEFKLDNSNVTVSYNIIGKDNAAIDKEIENFDNDDKACEYAGQFLTGFKPSSISDFDKELHEFFFEDEDDVKWDTARTSVYAVLENDKLISSVEKSASVMDAAIGKLIKSIDKAESEYTKNFKSDTDHASIKTSYSVDLSKKDDATADTDSPANFNSSAKTHQKKQSALNLLSKQASAYQVAINKISAGLVREAKFHASQCRSALAKAVAYRPQNESCIDTIADAIAYDPSIVL